MIIDAFAIAEFITIVRTGDIAFPVRVAELSIFGFARRMRVTCAAVFVCAEVITFAVAAEFLAGRTLGLAFAVLARFAFSRAVLVAFAAVFVIGLQIDAGFVASHQADITAEDAVAVLTGLFIAALVSATAAVLEICHKIEAAVLAFVWVAVVTDEIAFGINALAAIGACIVARAAVFIFLGEIAACRAAESLVVRAFDGAWFWSGFGIFRAGILTCGLADAVIAFLPGFACGGALFFGRRFTSVVAACSRQAQGGHCGKPQTCLFKVLHLSFSF